MEFFDTHCHVHSARANRGDFTAKKWQEAGETDPEALVTSAARAGVSRLLCIGTDIADSEEAVEFVRGRENCWATVGVHPHEAQDFDSSPTKLQRIRNLLDEDKKGDSSKIVAIGECGLDFYYEHSPRQTQIKLLELQLGLAKKHKLPLVLHIRQAYDEFWPVFDSFGSAGERITAVVHSFTGTPGDLQAAIDRDLYIGLNGIMTFTGDESQLQAAKRIPLDRLLLETDAPYLTPKPFRGKICKPEHMVHTAKFLADLRGETIGQVANATTENAVKLFKL